MALEVYKPNQGVYARAVTGAGGGIMAAFGSYQLHGALINMPPVYPGAKFVVDITYGLLISLAVFGALGGAIALVVTGASIGLKKIDRSSKDAADFLIETEGELRKVSWPSREELTGSTFVVIFVTSVLGVYIVTVDWVVSTIMQHLGIL